MRARLLTGVHSSKRESRLPSSVSFLLSFGARRNQTRGLATPHLLGLITDPSHRPPDVQYTAHVAPWCRRRERRAARRPPPSLPSTASPWQTGRGRRRGCAGVRVVSCREERRDDGAVEASTALASPWPRRRHRLLATARSSAAAAATLRCTVSPLCRPSVCPLGLTAATTTC